MQFKHPEILWALFLLLIPILIHLFQLRRFKKTPFTNVKLLKKVVSESRKSSTLKKWLLLLSRLLLLGSLVLAFAQPFSADEIALQTKETVFFLDNSFSMTAKTDTGTLLQNTVQDFIKSSQDAQKFTLFTNDDVFREVEIKDIQNSILNLPTSKNQLSLEEILLKANTYFKELQGVQKNIVVISDFQQRMGPLPIDSTLGSKVHFVKPQVGDFINSSVDSVYLETMNNETIEIVALVSSNKKMESTPVSLYDKDKLVAKTSAIFDRNNKAKVEFSIPATQAINGRVVLSDNGLSYDNQFYFNIDKREKIKILAIGSREHGYLKRIFSDDEFLFSSSTLEQLNFATLETQNLIVLNELATIPTGLATALKSFTANGGSFVVIPNIDVDVVSYNQLSSVFSNTNYLEKMNQEVLISQVVFEHPLYTNVFQSNVTNFQYPKATSYFGMRSAAPAALYFQNKTPFLIGNDNSYFFTASLAKENSNFKNSPLVVPTFYKMGINSLKLPRLYHTIGDFAEIDIPISLSKDNILKLTNGDYEFIPQQRSLPKKVRLSFVENPVSDGIFLLKDGDDSLRNISFNYNRLESELKYFDLTQLKVANQYESVADFFQETQKANAINEFWKWFAILALLFVLVETILQRFLK